MLMNVLEKFSDDMYVKVRTSFDELAFSVKALNAKELTAGTGDFIYVRGWGVKFYSGVFDSESLCNLRDNLNLLLLFDPPEKEDTLRAAMLDGLEVRWSGTRRRGGYWFGVVDGGLLLRVDEKLRIQSPKYLLPAKGLDANEVGSWLADMVGLERA